MKLTILICSLAVGTPQNCTEENALAVVRPVLANPLTSPIECLLAGIMIGPEVIDRYYDAATTQFNVVCR